VVKLAGSPRAQIKDVLSGNLVDGARIRLEPRKPVLLDLSTPLGAK
jgi:hypothetical protein